MNPLTLHVQPGAGANGRAFLYADGLTPNADYVFDLRRYDYGGGKYDYDDKPVKADATGRAQSSWDGPAFPPASYLGVVSGPGGVRTIVVP